MTLNVQFIPGQTMQVSGEWVEVWNAKGETTIMFRCKYLLLGDIFFFAKGFV